jgi:site-specific recombinase XerD
VPAATRSTRARRGPTNVKTYRQHLVQDGYAPGAIANKLTVLRRFYQAAVAAGLRQRQPGRRHPLAARKNAGEDFGNLSEVELTLLFRAAPHLDKEGPLRDRAILALFGLQGLRTVEIQRANRDDQQQPADGWPLLVRGKFHGRRRCGGYPAVHLRRQSGDRSAHHPAQGTLHRRRLSDPHPAEAAAGVRTTPSATRRPPWRIGIRTTCAVQDLLGHSDPCTTARYARVVDMARTNPVLSVPVKL